METHLSIFLFFMSKKHEISTDFYENTIRCVILLNEAPHSNYYWHQPACGTSILDKDWKIMSINYLRPVTPPPKFCVLENDCAVAWLPEEPELYPFWRPPYPSPGTTPGTTPGRIPGANACRAIRAVRVKWKLFSNLWSEQEFFFYRIFHLPGTAACTMAMQSKPKATNDFILNILTIQFT